MRDHGGGYLRRRYGSARRTDLYCGWGVPGDTLMGSYLRLTPLMASRKLQALGFIKRYIADHGGSPSYDEIAEALGTNKARVRAIVRVLADEGKLFRLPGARRGITLPGDIESAIRLLRASGMRVDSDVFVPVTNTTLPRVPPLKHIPDPHLGGELHDPGNHPAR